MKLHIKLTLAVSALMLAAAPTALATGKPADTPKNNNAGPKSGLPAKAKAYGRYCKGESRKHVKGEKGTAFSRCVRNMAQAANHKNMAPGRVCKGESRKHVKGEKGTPFSRCVRDVVQLRRQERREARQQRREEREARQQEKQEESGQEG